MNRGRHDEAQGAPILRGALIYAPISLLSLLALWYFRVVLLPVILGLILAYLLSPPVRLLEGRGLSSTLSITIVYTLLGALLIGGCFFIFPVVIAQLEKLARALPEYSSLVTQYVDRAQQGMYRVQLPQTLQVALLNVIDRAEDAFEGMVESSIDAMFLVLGHSLSLLAAPVLAFYFLKDRHHLGSVARTLIGPSRRPHVEQLLGELDAVLMGFIRSRLLVSAFVGTATVAVFALLGLPYFLLIGTIVAIADLIPYFGPIIGAIPALAVAAVYSPPAAIKVLIALVVIQQLESVVVSPLVMGDGVSLHPVWVVIALFVGARVGGLFGMVLAVPVFACLRVVGAFAVDLYDLDGLWRR